MGEELGRTVGPDEKWAASEVQYIPEVTCIYLQILNCSH